MWLQVSALGHSRAACFDRYYASRIEAGLRVFRAFLRHLGFGAACFQVSGLRGSVFGVAGFRSAGFRAAGLHCCVVCALQGCVACTFQAPASDLQAFVGLQAQTSEVANSFTWIK